MMYGYSDKKINEYGLLELREITFATDPDSLRDIARFLNEMANEMERGAFEHCSHRHIGSSIEGWDSRNSNMDIIVMPPGDE